MNRPSDHSHLRSKPPEQEFDSYDVQWQSFADASIMIRTGFGSLR
jgi:hypothetical protein